MSLFEEKSQTVVSTLGGVAGGTATGIGSAAVSLVKGYSKGFTKEFDSIFGLGGSAISKKFDPNGLTSWGNLNPYLLASIAPCKSNGDLISGETVIQCPISDATKDMSFNWQSAFENAGAESKAPSFMALIQSGQTGAYANALQVGLQAGANAIGSKTLEEGANALGKIAQKATEMASELVGRTGITKLNSRQIFSGSPPMKISCTLHFRAIRDAYAEVEEPYNRLEQWVVPQDLADTGALAQLITNTADKQYIKALFPSLAPMFIRFTYAGIMYPVMVIETMSNPIDDQKDSLGRTIARKVNVTLSTLTAIDRQDVKDLLTILSKRGDIL